MIDTVIFDIGNVLASFRWREFIREFGYDEDTCERIGRAAMKSEAWNHFDAGMDEDEVLKEFISNDPGIEKELREVFADIGGTIKMYDTSIPFLESLREAGYRRLILSNLSKKTVRECAKDLVFLDHVDGGILSYRVGLIKPYEDIYLCLMRRYDLQPSRCVFIDDREENILAAGKLGMNGIVHKGIDNTLEELDAMGVRCGFKS